MDPFTESILSRARNRKNLLTNPNEELNKDEIEDPQSKVLTEQNVNPNSLIKSPSSGNKSSQGSQKTKTLCFQKENLNMEIKVTSSDDVRVEVEFEESSDSEETKSGGAGLRKNVKDRLKRLGKLYAGGDDANLSSPIHRTEEKFMSECKSNKVPETKKVDGKFRKGLENLAKEMNCWEDEIKTASKKEKEPLKWDKSVLDSLESQGFQRKTKESKLVFNYAEIEKTDTVEEKNSKEEKKIPKNIEKTNLKSFPKNEVAKNENKFDFSQKKAITQDPSSLSISERKALFERNQGEVLLPKAPFAMSIPLNEKSNNKSSDMNKTNKVQISNAKSKTKDVTENLITLENVKLKKVKTNDDSPAKTKNIDNSWKPAVKSVTKKLNVPTTVDCTSRSKRTATTVNNNSFNNGENSDQNPSQVAVHQSGGIASTMEALFKKKDTISEKQIQNQIKEQRMKEMEVLMNRFKRKEVQEEVIEEEDEEIISEDNSVNEENKVSHSPVQKVINTNSNMDSPMLKRLNEENSVNVSPSPRRSGGKRSSVSPRVAAVLEDVKRIKVSPAKPGRIYPSLSDIEASKETTETEPEDGLEDSSAENSSIASYSGVGETSFGKEILEAVCKNQTPLKRAIFDDSTASDVSDVLGDMDDYLDEALEYDKEKESMGPTPPKLAKSKDISFPSHSFHYKDYSPDVNRFKSPVKCKVSVEQSKPVQVDDGGGELPLTYTVSFYRKQTNNMASASPMKIVSRQEDSCPEPDKQQEILAKIKFLQTEVQRLQIIISQTSQALNLCNNTLEFMGSTEQVEAEKVLLVSTHRRQAALNEIQRLKVEESLRPQNHNSHDIPIEKGTLTISEIVLPLKKDYVRALAAAGGKGHHVICLVKSAEEVVASKLVSTVATNIKDPCYELTIPGSILLKNIYNDSTITFEVYCLQAQEEILPHEVKYHIKKSKATPKKSKQDSLLSRPIKESPGGPQAVRSPSFALMGYVVFSVHKMNRKSWSLNNTPSMSPLEGSVEMIVSCELITSVEYRGFLTMFEDISGFGAWHRRWCLLKGDSLSYWKYPDDEKRIPPINSIDLKSCINKEIGPVSRDICARLHTFLIETEREPLPEDKETLTTICKKNKTIIRHLLSADTKEERIKWCSQFNTILLANKICGNNQ